MSEIEINGQYTVRAGRTITDRGSPAFLLDASVAGESPYLINAGTVNVIGTGSIGGVIGVDTGNYGSGRGVLNQAGGVFSITSTVQGEGVKGFVLSGGGFTNDGEVRVSSQQSGATGVSNRGAMDFTNTGAFEVSGVGAHGVYIANGGSFNNTGHFTVNGGDQFTVGADLQSGNQPSIDAVNAGEMLVNGENAIGFAMYGGGTLNNSGDIVATGTAAAPASIGVMLSFGRGVGFDLVNTGTIQGAYAVREYDSGNTGASTITNKGTMRGDLELNHGHDAVINAGTIVGNVLLGVDNDSYLTQGNGALKGVAYGGDGNDTLAGGKHIDILFGDTSATATKNDGADLISGGNGADQLTGGGGADTLIGGGGADRLDVGTGADVLIYSALTDSKVSASDHITGLVTGDIIDLSALDADTTQKGNQAFTLVSHLDGHAGEAAMLYDASSGTTALVLDIDGDGAADFKAVIDGDLHGFTGFVL